MKPWVGYCSLGLSVMLAVDVVLLMIQNHDLKHRLEGRAKQGQPLGVGDSVPPLELKSLDGSVFTISYDEPDKRFLYFVLSTSCPYCEKNMGYWDRLAQAIGSDSVWIFGISIHDKERTGDYFARHQPNFPILLLADTSTIREYKFFGVPQTILIRGNGKVEGVWVGLLPDEQKQDLQTAIAKH